MSDLFWFLAVIYALASACFCAEVAHQKRQSTHAWFFGGLFFGILALIAIAGLPEKRSPNP